MKIQDACPTCGALCDVDLGAEESEYVAIEQAATSDALDRNAILEEVAQRLYCEEMRRSAEIVRSMKGDTTRDAPSADAVDAQRYRKLKRCGAIVDWTHTGPWKFDEDIDAALDNDKAIAATAPKGDGND